MMKTLVDPGVTNTNENWFSTRIANASRKLYTNLAEH